MFHQDFFRYLSLHHSQACGDRGMLYTQYLGPSSGHMVHLGARGVSLAFWLSQSVGLHHPLNTPNSPSSRIKCSDHLLVPMVPCRPLGPSLLSPYSGKLTDGPVSHTGIIPNPHFHLLDPFLYVEEPWWDTGVQLLHGPWAHIGCLALQHSWLLPKLLPDPWPKHLSKNLPDATACPVLPAQPIWQLLSQLSVPH